MQAEKQMGVDDRFDVLSFLWSKRVIIGGMSLVGLVAGSIVSFMITPLFRSEVILFPAVTHSVSRALLTEQSTGRDDILGLGDEEDSEQLLQMLHSDKVKERVSKRFNLMSVYRIDSLGGHQLSDLNEAFKDHIKFEQTRYSSVRVEVLDKDPKRASDIANFISDQVDSVWSEMSRERASKGFDLVLKKVAQLDRELVTMADSMRILREMGVHDYHTQTERYNEYLGAAIVKGDQRAVRDFEERFKVLAKYGGAYVNLQDRLYNETKRMSVLKMKLEQAQADMESNLPHKFLVNRAVPSDRRAYPVRWLIAMGSTLSALLLALILIVVQANLSKIRSSNVQ